jgi:hypothetical protein
MHLSRITIFEHTSLYHKRSPTLQLDITMRLLSATKTGGILLARMPALSAKFVRHPRCIQINTHRKVLCAIGQLYLSEGKIQTSGESDKQIAPSSSEFNISIVAPANALKFHRRTQTF